MSSAARADPGFETLASGYALVEGPTADAGDGLVFSDVLGGGVFRRAPDGSFETLVPKRRGVGGIALHAEGGVVVSGRDLVHVRAGLTRTLLSIPGLPGWNDLCTDSRGRVYAGALRFAVFDPGAAALPGECWRVEAAGRASELYGGLVHANGIALSPDERTIVHSDTRRGVVVVHDRLADGQAVKRRELAVQGPGQPDPRLRRGRLRVGGDHGRRARGPLHTGGSEGRLARGARPRRHERVLRGE